MLKLCNAIMHYNNIVFFFPLPGIQQRVPGLALPLAFLAQGKKANRIIGIMFAKPCPFARGRCVRSQAYQVIFRIGGKDRFTSARSPIYCGRFFRTDARKYAHARDVAQPGHEAGPGRCGQMPADGFGMDSDQVMSSRYYHRNPREAIPLTIAMLIESARAGRWLFS